MHPPIFTTLLQNLEKVIHGKSQILREFLTSYFAGGHILLEDVPGVGKTTLVKAMSLSLTCEFHRIQFTPDLMPSDITGTMIYHPKNNDFQFRQGPIFSDILLADEINRASPRTQSALLEAMNEGQVTVEGVAKKLSPIFTVIATQNPVDFHGTYPLPEAQLDRFGICLSLGYPEYEDEFHMITSQHTNHPLTLLQPVATTSDVIRAREEVRNVMVSANITNYILDIVKKTRTELGIRLGISPRGAIFLYRMAQARAWTRGSNFVLPDDVKNLAASTLSHRIIQDINTKNIDKKFGRTNRQIILDILENIKVPV